MQWLKHAFAIPDAADFSPTPAERQLAFTVRQELRRRGLQLPASVLMESTRPLGYVAAQALWVSYPWFASLTDAAGLKILGQMLERPGSVDWFLDYLNSSENAPADSATLAGSGAVQS